MVSYDLFLIAQSLEILERSRRLLDETWPACQVTVPSRPLNVGSD